LRTAYKLHHIKDVYIIEHRDCGAYREFLGTDGDFDEDEADKEAESQKALDVACRAKMLLDVGWWRPRHFPPLRYDAAPLWSSNDSVY
jgi:hypothetical protein